MNQDMFSWIVIFLGLSGVLAAAGYLVFAHFPGREISGFKGLVVSIIVCILANSAGAIVQTFV